MYIPISKVDENMKRAQMRDAVNQQKFFFRKEIFQTGRRPAYAPTEPMLPTPPNDQHDLRLTNSLPAVPFDVPQELTTPVEDEYEELTMDQVINGKDDYPGLLGLVNSYLNALDVEFSTRMQLQRYLDLIKHRADGTLVTTATWIRNFVRDHPLYKHDSVVTQEINYDLMIAIDEVERGVRVEPTLLPADYVRNMKTACG